MSEFSGFHVPLGSWYIKSKRARGTLGTTGTSTTMTMTHLWALSWSHSISMPDGGHRCQLWVQAPPHGVENYVQTPLLLPMLDDEPFDKWNNIILDKWNTIATYRWKYPFKMNLEYS